MSALILTLLHADWSPGPLLWVWLFGQLLGLLSAPSVLLQRRGQPLGATAWLLLLLSAPYVGVFAWWLLGRRHLIRRREQHRRATRAVSQRLLDRALAPDRDSFAPLLPIQHLTPEARWSVFPPAAGNAVDVLEDAAQAYPALERMIAEAQHHIHLLFYIWQQDATGTRFRDLLIARARAGVEVRLLYDAVGSPRGMDRFLAPLRAAGGKTAPFFPLRIARKLTLNFRNHRKIVVVDGQQAFAGGLNIGDEYTRGWHDIGVHLRGPSVDALQEVFADDWCFATGEDLARRPYFGAAVADRRPPTDLPGAEDPDALCGVIASGPDNRHNLTHDAFFLAITQAKERIWLVTPYFIPSPTLLVALRTSVMRGVDVRLLLPEKSDVPIARLAARAWYPELLASGVRIFEYQAAILHAKALVFDRDLAVLGSANLDTRSFRLSFEVSCFFGSTRVCAALSDLISRDMARSREVLARDLPPGRTWDRALESAAHLFSPLL